MKLLQLGKCHQKNNKRGGMLVIVLMIFAVSLILISSAMTTTLSSRSRYYVNTEKSQERLTLTCAAEAIVDAIESQEITDDQIIQMSKSSDDKYFITGVDSTAYPYAQSTLTSTDGKEIAPGLAGETDTSRSRTYFTVEPEEGGGTNDVVLTFRTLIDVTGEDSNSENLKVHLKWSEDGSDHNLCGNMVTAGDDSNPGFLNVQDLMVNTTESYTVLHGNVLMSNDSQSYIENTAVITGTWKGGQGTRFWNDIIFYGKNATIDVGSGGNGVSTTGDVIFIGENATTGRAHVFSNGTPPGGFNFTADGLYLYNAEMTNVGSAVKGNSQNVAGIWEFSHYSGQVNQGKYWVVDTGSEVKRTAVNSGASNVIINNGVDASKISVPGDSATIYTKDNIGTSGSAADQAAYTRISNKGKNYRADADLKKAVQTKVPSAHSDYEKYATMVADNTITSGCGHVTYDGGKAPNSSNAARHLYMPAGNYSGGEVYIDLTKGNASIYIGGSVTLKNFAIRVSNTNIGSNKLVIVLAKGATLRMVSAPEPWTAGSPTQNGIISCDQRHSSFTADGWSNDMRATSGQIPGCIIVGLGKNTVELACPSILDAYVSLAGIGDNASTFKFGGGQPQKPVAFYGRVEAAKIQNGAGEYGPQGGQMHMEYCPGLDEQSSGDDPLHTCYTADSYEYFY